MSGSMDKEQWACNVFDKTEQVWQLKWPPATCLVLNWQLTSLAAARRATSEMIYHRGGEPEREMHC